MKILQSGLFDEIFVPPASGDNGTAIGACYLSTKNMRSDLSTKRFDNYYIGSEFSNEIIENSLRKKNVSYSKPKNLERFVAQKLNEQKIIGWFQCRMEAGPRALGGRSILGDPRKIFFDEKISTFC